MPVPAAIYARVSTGEQSCEQQVTALREAADRMRLAPVLVVEETGSGAKADRPGLLRVMDAARLGEVRAVLVWKLDRLGRSVLDLARNVDEFRRLGVRLVAVTQGSTAKMAADMLAAVAEYERPLIVERTRAGMDRAKRNGTKSGRPIGRPQASQVMLHAAGDLALAGVPIAEAARRKGVARTTLQRFLRS